MGRNSVDSTATRDGLDGPGIESWWGAKFSAPVQIGPRAHTVFPIQWVLGFLPGGKAAEAWL